jgi:hypothetical protein
VSYCRSVHIKERLRLINKQEDRKAERHFFIYVISFYLKIFYPLLANRLAAWFTKNDGNNKFSPSL